MSKRIFGIKGKNTIYGVIGGLAVRLSAIIGLLLLGWYLNKTFEALVALVAILQFEIAYRQLWLAMRHDEPIISVYSLEEGDKVYLKVKNLGPTVAFSVGVGNPFKYDEFLSLVTHHSTKHLRICFSVKREIAESLEPSSEAILATFNRDFYEILCRGDYAFMITYFDRDGKPYSFIVRLFGGKPRVIRREEEPRGF